MIKPFRTVFTLSEALAQYSKHVLRGFGACVGCHLPMTMKKAVMAQTLAGYVLGNVREVLALCSAWEVGRVRDFVAAGPGVALAVPGRATVSPMELILGFRQELDEETGLRWGAIADELREKVGSTAEVLLADPAFLARSERLQAVRGLLVLYGAAPMAWILNEMMRFYPDDDEDERLSLFFAPEFLYSLDIEELESEESAYVYSPQLHDVFEDEMELFEQIRPGVEFKSFSLEQALLAGEMPLPRFGLPAERKLREVLQQRGGLTLAAANDLIYDLWLDKQDFDAPPTSYLDVVKEKVEFHSLEDIQIVVDAVGDFVNDVPCWPLLGNASNEIRPRTPLTRPPKMVMGPNMRKAGWREEDLQAMADAAFYGGVADSMLYKAGRNDPCPCGSGLKFKNCHGKGS